MNLDFNISPYWLILLLPLAIGLSIVMYRKLQDRISRPLRIVLIVLRSLTLVILAILLLEPLLSYFTRVNRLPSIAFIQDRSESLVLHNDSNFVKNEYPGLLKNFISTFDRNALNTDLWGFGTELQANLEPDSLQFRDAGTNMAGAIAGIEKYYRNQYLGAIVLAGDGIYNAGANPIYQVEAIPYPVYTVLLGDTTQRKDVLVKNVLFNEIAYLNTDIPIKVTIQLQGEDRADLNVSIRSQNKELASQKLSLGSGKNEGDVLFNVRATETGLQQFQINVSRIEGEISYKNNTRTIFINVLENRYKIAIFAGSPHPDLGALHKTFEKAKDYEVEEFILKTATGFYQTPDFAKLEDFDLIMLHNFPQSAADAPVMAKIKDLIERKKIPVIYWVGSTTFLQGLTPLYDLMAITPTEIVLRSEEVQLTFVEAYKRHSTFTFQNDWMKWADNTPPVFRNRSVWNAKASAEVFATARIKNVQLDYPVYALQNRLGVKNMVFLGENFWRMRAHSFIETESFDYFDDWVINNIKWLTSLDDKRRFKVETHKRIYTGNEPVIVKGQAYDDSYNPMGGVEIKFTLIAEDGIENEYYLTESSQGQYSLEIGRLQEGNYRYTAIGKKGDTKIGEDKGIFTIGKYNTEHLQLRANIELMKQIALRSGGEFVLARNMGELPEKIRRIPNLKPIIDYKRERNNFLKYPWLLGLLLALLAIEWIVRKWNGLS